MKKLFGKIREIPNDTPFQKNARVERDIGPEIWQGTITGIYKRYFENDDLMVRVKWDIRLVLPEDEGMPESIPFDTKKGTYTTPMWAKHLRIISEKGDTNAD